MENLKKEKKIIKYFPKFDTPFKNLFKTKKNKNLLIDFLNDFFAYEDKKSVDGNNESNDFNTGNSSSEKNFNPIIDIQFLNTEIPAEQAVNTFIIENWEDFNSEEKKNIFKELNDEENMEIIAGTKKRRNKKDSSNNKTKRLKKNYFETKAPSLDTLINIIREKYIEEIENEKKIIELKNENAFKFIALTRTNELINIEIQLQNTDNIFKRTLYYEGDIISHALKRGTDYNTLPKIVIINFLHYNVFSNEDQFKWCFNLKDNTTKTEEGFEGLLNFHFIELLKYENLEENEKMEEKNLWFLFLVDPNNEIFLKDGAPKKFIQAREVLISLEEKNNYNNDCDKEVQAYNEYLKGLKYRQELGRKEGREIGKEEGYKIGKEEGRQEKVIEIGIFLLKQNYDIEEIKKITNLDSSDILEIKKLMNKSDDILVKKLAKKLNIDPNDLIKFMK